MKCTRAVARLGMLALGLGFGGAIASTPGTASAATSFDWLSAVDSAFGGALPAETTPALNLSISFDGISLFQSGSAHAFSGNGDIAIANGAGSSAYAFGTSNYAYVDGTGSTAIAGGMTDTQASGSFDNTAFVFGDSSTAVAGGTSAANPGTFNYAVIFGDGDKAFAGASATHGGNYDGAYVEGDHLATADARGGDYLAAIVKFYGDGANSTAASADSTNLTDLVGGDPSGVWADANTFWTDLFSGDTAGAWAAGQDFWADLASSFDVSGAAADSGNFWTDLATLF